MQNEYTADDIPSPSAPTAASTSAAAAAAAAATPNDDELMIKSTVSDTFDTWTILTNKDDRPKPSGENDLLQDRIELLKEDAMPEDEKSSAEDFTPKKTKFKTDEEPQTDDLSDGISIISDCESTERISPVSSIRGGFNIDEQFRTSSPAIDLAHLAGVYADDEPLRVRNRRANSRQSLDASDSDLESHNQDVHLSLFPPIVERGLTGLFYVAVSIAILALVGKLRYPVWQASGDDRPISEIQQKLNDLELQNHLMRSEIDILSKQVNYLGSLKDAPGARGSEQPKHYNQRQGKTFKAWAGNGNNMNPVHITKDDLKKAYECPDGEFVEFAALCLEQKGNAESVVDYIKNTIDEGLQQAEAEAVDSGAEAKISNEQPEIKPSTYNGEQNFKQSGNKVQLDIEKPLILTKQILDQMTPEELEYWLLKADYDKSRQERRSYGKRQRIGKYIDNSKENYKREHDHSKENFEREHDHSKEYTKRAHDHSKEKTYAKYNNTKSKMDNKKYKKDYSKEQRHYDNRNNNNNNNNNKNSKERLYNNKKASNTDSSKQNKQQQQQQHDNSGEWHEQMMRQREDARRDHQQHADKNWYIERSDNREQLRYTEKPPKL